MNEEGSAPSFFAYAIEGFGRVKTLLYRDGKIYL